MPHSRKQHRYERQRPSDVSRNALIVVQVKEKLSKVKQQQDKVQKCWAL